MGLKDLFSKVISGIAKGVGGDEAAPEDPLPPGQEEPIQTRTMAELLVEQGHLERAAAILRTLPGHDSHTRLVEVEALRGLEGNGLTTHRERDLCGMAWKIDEGGISAAEALLGSSGTLTLRIVSVTGRSGVATRSEDDRAVEPTGSLVLEAASGTRLIVSVGLARAGRFVSIAHDAG